MKFIEALNSIRREDVVDDEYPTKVTSYWDIGCISYPGLDGEFNTSDGDIWFIRRGVEGLGGYHWTNDLPRLPLSDYTTRNDWYVSKR